MRIVIVKIIFTGSFGITGFILSYSENRILLKPVLGGVASAACFINGHEQTQSFSFL